MKVDGRHWRAVEWNPRTRSVRWIDQTRLPFRFVVHQSDDPARIATAIERMEARGAPTIGAIAALGLALAWLRDRDRFDAWCTRFAQTRPTAVNLFHAIDAMRQAAARAHSESEMIDAACGYAEAEVARNRRIGAHAAELLARGQRRILTHCNAGWLAAVDWGTATAGIYALHRAGERPFVWVDETRPRLQGARLTAWELDQEGIAHRIQIDAAAAVRMQRGEVDAIVVGADRIAANGDVANKIGTYMLACLAQAHRVPLFVAAPSTTIDPATPNGDTIPIETRDPDEIRTADGIDTAGRRRRVRITHGSPAHNPAFDVTPFAWITAIITEHGIWQPRSR